VEAIRAISLDWMVPSVREGAEARAFFDFESIDGGINRTILWTVINAAKQPY
jgi:hypothetical protein